MESRDNSGHGDHSHRGTPGDAQGRHADKPGEIPKRGWKSVLKRVKQQMGEDNLSIVAAGVAFYGFLAMVPAIAAAVAIYGLVVDSGQLSQHLDMVRQVAPQEVMPILEEQMTRVASDSKAAGWGAALGILIALFGASKATMALIKGLNIVYGEHEKRGFFKLYAIGLGLTLAAIVGVIVLLVLVAALPAILSALPIGSTLEQVLQWLRWPVMIALFAVALAVLYRFAPSRDAAQWKWLSWGAGIAAILWLIASIGFSIYVSTMGSYDKVYGPLGAIVVFLMWLFLTAYVVLLGGEFNSETERQTMKDTTKGDPRPMGRRGARVADEGYDAPGSAAATGG